MSHWGPEPATSALISIIVCLAGGTSTLGAGCEQTPLDDQWADVELQAALQQARDFRSQVL